MLFPTQRSLFIEPVLLVILIVESLEFYDLLKNFVSFLRGLEELFLHSVVFEVDSPISLVVIVLRDEAVYIL